MKKTLLLTILTLGVAVTALADSDDRHQSYLSYDDGGTVVRSGEDNREIDAHRNLPIYPGDEVVTARRGRAEVRLSDGNIIGIDRTTAILFRSILDAYEGEGDETVVELRYGKVAVHRTDIGRDHVRLDTDNASYIAERESVYSVETSTNGKDRVTVFDGAIEVRTRTRATRLRDGESATIDSSGLYDLVGDQRHAADDFERWFLKRADRFENFNSRYVDRRLGYWADDLDDHGRWVFVSGIGWSWRPYVAVGWRPYYNGYWHYGRAGCLTWVSHDPWAWGTYHYGRWAFDPGFGWVWVPGFGYSPAWVYWMYGPGYVGWAPSGWWDCYRSYYRWAYHPYRNYDYGHHRFGFNGRVRVSEVDLRPWTFVDSGVLISHRVDRAALTADVVKNRLTRSRDGFVNVRSGVERFTREEYRDPAAAIRKRGIDGRLTGRETGPGGQLTDLTPFLRRDAEVPGTIRDRLVRSRTGGGGGGAASPGGVVSTPARDARVGGGGLAPIGGGSVAPVGRGSVAPIGGGSSSPAPAPGLDRRTGGGADGRLDRDRTTPPADRGSGDRDDAAGSNWRDRVRERAVQPRTPATTPAEPSRTGRDDTWRARSRDRDASSGERGSSTGSDAPRRVIDGIGGARVVPRDNDSGRSRNRETVRDRSTSRGSSGSRGSGSRDRGTVRDSGSSRGSSGSGNSGSRESARPSSPPPSRDSGSSRDSSGGGNRDSGGRVRRDG